MKQFRSTVCLLLCLALCTVFLPVSAAAAGDADTYNQNTKEMAARLSSVYDIDIAYSIAENGYATVGTATLANLENALQLATPSLIRQMSAYCREAHGKRLTIRYTYLPSNLREPSYEILGSYESDKALIELYIPQKSSDLSSGNSPMVILHEVGHLFHDYIEYRSDATKLKQYWLYLNGSAPYSFHFSNSSPYPTVFASAYAATDYSEDVAETFAFAFTANRAGLGISPHLKDSSGNQTRLGQKIGYVGKLISAFFTDTDKALANLQKVYTTPASTTYMGYQMSGSVLEYIGFYAPAGLAPNVLAQAGLSGQPHEWKSEIGGWLVTTGNGDTWLLFPGGQSAKISAQSRAA